MTRGTSNDLDLDMLAYDIANMLDTYGYPIDVCDADIRPHLESFITAVRASAAAHPGDETTREAA